ncbi:MAG: ADP-heptose--LPS heptosyltransferase [Thermoanaerobaculia bacterium]
MLSITISPLMPNDAEDWFRCMRRGDFSRAWEITDADVRRRRGQPCWHLPRHLQWIWDGTPLDGKRVLIRCYHGLGDTLQFIRYAALVKQIAAEVIVWAPAALLPLLQTVEGIDRLLPLHDGSPEVEYDVDVEVMELAHVFRSTLDTLPRDIPYVHAPPAPPLRSPAIGLFWQGGDWDGSRSIRFEDLTPILETGLSFVPLQRELTETHPSFVIREEVNTIHGTASLMRALDLVITVDSMPAHLAGALGIPVWTLLPAVNDWRWMENRDDSPWYPTMKLFRQETADDWTSVIRRVASSVMASR